MGESNPALLIQPTKQHASYNIFTFAWLRFKSQKFSLSQAASCWRSKVEVLNLGLCIRDLLRCLGTSFFFWCQSLAPAHSVLEYSHAIFRCPTRDTSRLAWTDATCACPRTRSAGNDHSSGEEGGRNPQHPHSGVRAERLAAILSEFEYVNKCSRPCFSTHARVHTADNTLGRARRRRNGSKTNPRSAALVPID